ncbi:hypothetical protein AB870_06530 [Pandoraea faecigallinarum]|uniref:Uncharacterized protein n=1 Tax=Pandoraea faecigallinarum TaxID=656179 RepID=A0A0H3WTI0_9BURK|nr:hypothetical protein AB870_06530 [Pandoraea faecigallinarum]
MARAGASPAGMGPGRRWGGAVAGSGASGVSGAFGTFGTFGAGVGVADMGTIIKRALKDIDRAMFRPVIPGSFPSRRL